MTLPPAVIGISPGTLGTAPEVADFTARVGRALAGGLSGLLLREPRLEDGAYLELASELRDRLASGWLGVHDRVHLARAVEADAVHLGFRSLPLAEVLRQRAPETSVGLSTHEGDDPESWRAADYRFLGPVEATPSKEGWVTPLGAEGFARARGDDGVPVWALGGLEPHHLSALRERGASGVAVLRGILGAPDPERAAAAHLAAWSDSE